MFEYPPAHDSLFYFSFDWMKQSIIRVSFLSYRKTRTGRGSHACAQKLSWQITRDVATIRRQFHDAWMAPFLILDSGVQCSRHRIHAPVLGTLVIQQRREHCHEVWKDGEPPILCDSHLQWKPQPADEWFCNYTGSKLRSTKIQEDCNLIQQRDKSQFMELCHVPLYSENIEIIPYLKGYHDIVSR